MIRAALRHPVLSSAAAAAASVAAILGIALVAHVRAVIDAIGHLHPSWLGVVLAAEMLSLPSYALAYRAIVRRYGHQYLTRRVTLHMVLAGAMLWPWALGVPVAGLLTVGLLLYARRRSATWRPRLRKLADHGWLLIGMSRELARLPQAWCGIGLYFAADIASLYAAVRAVGLRLGVGAVLIAYASGYLFTRRTLPLASAAFVELFLTCSLFWVGVPLASALAAVIVYRTLGLPLFVAGGMLARTLLWPLMREPPASQSDARERAASSGQQQR
jgi:hypothetical protein